MKLNASSFSASSLHFPLELSSRSSQGAQNGNEVFYMA